MKAYDQPKPPFLPNLNPTGFRASFWKGDLGMFYLDVCLDLNPKRIGAFRSWAEAQGLEVESYGQHTYSRVVYVENRDGITVPRIRVYMRPSYDYVTVRNVSEAQAEELRAFGRVLKGYPMRPRDKHHQAELRRPEPEKPTCPICRTDKNVHWVGRDHWTCLTQHLPQHFGSLRLS